MGDYSRDPIQRLAESVAKHYVGVRMQQGVPVLDADWNEMEGLRRHENEEVGRWFIGDGVPTGNNGFQIIALPNGGINTIVLVANTTSVGPSSLEIDLPASTAASAIGFDARNSEAQRYGSSPAQLTGHRPEPFAITANSTLVVKVDDRSEETITFTTAMPSATAAQVVAAMASATSITAKPGSGNDFIIEGGGGTAADAGRIIVEGQVALNDNDLQYTEQQLYQNQKLADLWGVQPVPKLQTPGADELDVAYLDIWNRDVNSIEDRDLLDVRIGVETAVRLRREWAVRVVKAADYEGVFAAKPAGHSFYVLAQIRRKKDEDAIEPAMIVNKRDTQVSVQRKIVVRSATGNVVVNNARFKLMLESTRNTVFAFIKYITTQFNSLITHMTAAEVLGLQAVEHVARTAENGIALISSENLANRGALNFFYQLHNAENNFMVVWRDVLLQLGTTPKKYATYQNFISGMNARLNNANVGSLKGLLPALQAGDLDAATTMQEEINRLIGTASASLPRGSIQVFLSKSPPGNLTAGPNPVRFEFRVHSFTTLAGTYTVAVLPAAGWPRQVVDSSGNPIPGNNIPIGSIGSETTIFLDVTVQAGSSGLQLRVTSDANPAEIDQLTGLFTLTEGQPAPIDEDKVQLHIASVSNAILDPHTGVVSIARTQQGLIELRVFNNTGVQATFNLTLLKESEVGGWTAEFSGAPILIINNGDSLPKVVKVTPAADAVSMQLRIAAATSIAGSTIKGEIVIPIGAT